MGVKFLAQTHLSLRWVHMSEGTFSHVETHILNHYNMNRRISRDENRRSDEGHM